MTAEIIPLRPRPREAGSEAAPVTTSVGVVTPLADEQSSALVRKLRFRFAVLTAICILVGWSWLATYFFVFTLFTATITKWVAKQRTTS